MAWQAAEYGERVSSGFGTPLVLPYALIPIGFIALSIQFLPGIFKPVMQIFKATKSS
jgi:TRAP-type C4-dicarboxylate transport system permease small subunit